MAKTTVVPLSAADKRYKKQIERNLAKMKRMQKEMAAEWKATQHLPSPQPSILEVVKANLGC